MRRSFLMPAAFALAFLTSGAMAQGRPDFSGVWQSVVQPAGFAASGTGNNGSLGSGWGASFAIFQDADALLVERVLYSRSDLQPPIRIRFALDGSETRNTFWMGRGEQVQVSTSAWDGNKLTITTVHTVPELGDGQTIASKVTRTLSLQSPPTGRSAWPPSLVIETVRGGVLGGPPSTTRTVYNKN